MIDMSECFNMIGTDGCMDVASSLVLQGVEPNIDDISIPIYEVFFLNIKVGDNCGFICDSLEEYTTLQNLNKYCGSVTVTLNILDMDLLTLAGALLIYTPNTGMNVFVKMNALNLTEDMIELIPQIAEVSGIPIPDMVTDNLDIAEDFLNTALEALNERLIEILHEDLESNNINVMDWSDLPDFYVGLRNSGEITRMVNYRRQVSAAIF